MNKAQTIFAFAAVIMVSVLATSTFAEQIANAASNPLRSAFDAKIKNTNDFNMVVSTVRVSGDVAASEPLVFTWSIVGSNIDATETYTLTELPTSKIKIGDIETGQIIIKYNENRDVLIGKFRHTGAFLDENHPYTVTGSVEGELTTDVYSSGSAVISHTSSIIL